MSEQTAPVIAIPEWGSTDIPKYATPHSTKPYEEEKTYSLINKIINNLYGGSGRDNYIYSLIQSVTKPIV